MLLFYVGPTCQNIPLVVKAILVLLLLLVIALVIAIALVPKKSCSSNASISGSEQCNSPYKQDTRLPKDPTVFQDLSKEEYHTVRDYMIKKSALNIVSHEQAKENTNYIYLIELYIPKKSEVLAYLDGNGKKPARKARVIITNGAKNPPDVEEYLVEPLPNPNKHSKLLMAGYSYPVPFASRPYTTREDDVIKAIAMNVTRDAYVILKESFGYWFHNCTKNCLVFYADGIAAADKSGDRQTWVLFFRNRRGVNILPVPFEFLIGHADKDTSKWKILQVKYFF